MPLIVKDTGVGEFERPESGLQHGVCSHVVDLGIQMTKFGEQPQVALVFELAAKMKDGRPFMVSMIHRSSLNEKANLRKHLESWRGKKFTDAELAGFDLEKLVGVNCYLNLIENRDGDKTYTNIASIVKLPKDVPTIKPIGQPVPAWLQKKADAGHEPTQEDWETTTKPTHVDEGDDLPF